ncbi:helix-turn-helix domain-containing protein [Borrelia hermsii]|uniref:helix-turn-helix domain-containing protein n=1 Tax=Borrelia hermsii TaxID=140 RepID=UPI0008DC27A4|nr:helix-turn-helix domain-containing protein [Borrelia hermsii]
MSANKAYKYRLYLNIKQREYLAKVFGYVRFVYSKIPNDKKRHYERAKQSLKVYPSQYKSELLREVDSLLLCNAQIDLECAIIFSEPKEKATKHKDFLNINLRKTNKHI